ncbi:hypothetical protein [Nocardioides plantarum]|uniref:Uncharacterized protein n=1 Tax=Nocardioides plantarum TaxID=29299 RepID=A0ABV5KFD1_9ACTN|nr:hypothetical protein [Nocardioides plantarum]
MVPELTTETEQVVAMPDGTFELTSYREAVRTRLDGDWAPIDTTLQETPQGTVAPVATTSDIVFSGGGSSDPMVRLTEPGSTETADVVIEVRWEAPLPEPVLDGDTVTYPAVRPGVDLVLTAQTSGFTQALVVEDEAAASALIADPPQVTTASTNADLSTDDDGSIVASDADGPVFTSAPAVMWDSHTPDDAGEEPGSSTPGNAKIRRLHTSPTSNGSSVEMTLAPPAAVLTDPTVQYPLFLDPGYDQGSTHYLTVHSKGWNYYDDANQLMRVGYCDWGYECNTAIQGNARSYFNFNINALTQSGADASIIDATVFATQVYGATSASQPVELHKAGAFTSSTNWPGPIYSDLQTISSNAGYGDNASATLAFSSAAVRSYVETTASAEDGAIQFALAAPATDNRNYWKKFSRNPRLVVTYGFTPTTPTNLSINGPIECAGQPRYASDSTPTLYATSEEQSSSHLSLDYYFEVWRNPDANYPTRVRYHNSGVPKASGTTASWSIASENSNTSARLPPGDYGFRVRTTARDAVVGDIFSDWSYWYRFTVETVIPDVPVTTSHTYPEDYWGAAENAEGTFIATGSADTAGFSWSIDAGTPLAVINARCDYSYTATTGLMGFVPATAGRATIRIPAGSLPGGQQHNIVIKAFSHSHLTSDSTDSYDFFVPRTFNGSTGKNVVEFENMTATPKTEPDPAAMATTYNSAVGSAWSGGKHAAIIANRGTPTAPTTVDYTFSVPVAGYYALGARLATANHLGKLSFTLVDPNPTTGDTRLPIYGTNRVDRLVVDTYSATTGFKYVPLGEYLPQQGVLLEANHPYQLSVDIVGKNPNSVSHTYDGTWGSKTFDNYADNGYSAALDSLTVALLRQANFSSLSAAFDNQGIGTTTASKFDLSTNGTTSLSRAALDDIGFVPGGDFSAGGTTFKNVPQANNTKDNVISSGQTINLPANQGGNFIYLLATSTCGPVGGAFGQDLTMYYKLADGTLATSSAPLLTVPDWLSNSGTSADTVAMSHYLNGTSRVTTGSPKLYVLKFPINANYTGNTVKSVTLPRVGTTYTTGGCGTPGAGALHVFAVQVGS